MGENSWVLSAWLPQPWPCLLRTLLMSRLPRLPSRLPLLLLRPESTLLLHQLKLPVLTWTTVLTWLLPRPVSLLLMLPPQVPQLPVPTWKIVLMWLLPRLPSLLSTTTLRLTTTPNLSTLATTVASTHTPMVPTHMPTVPTHMPLMLHTSWQHPRWRRLKHNVLEFRRSTGNWSPGHRKSIQNYTIGKGNCE